MTGEVAAGPMDVEELRQIEAMEMKRKEIERKRVESRLEMNELNSSLGRSFNDEIRMTNERRIFECEEMGEATGPCEA